MGDENPIRTLGDYSKPSHEGYKNTIELPVENNMDPNKHLKDFLKLVDSLDLDDENRERMRLAQSSDIEVVCTKGDDGEVMFIELIRKNDDSSEGEPKEEGSTTTEGIMRRKLDPRENSNRGVNNFTGRIKGIHVFVGNFTYIIDFMIVKDISSIIDPRLSQVVLGKPFMEISNMTHDPPEGVLRFINGADKVAYKMPHKIEQYNSLSDLEKKYTKSVYLRNEEDKRRGVEYVMRKILGFYKECLELRPEYETEMDDEGEVM
ncbi:hypothetical protein Tco_0736436 [Tanacetum coccineum]